MFEYHENISLYLNILNEFITNENLLNRLRPTPIIQEINSERLRSIIILIIHFLQETIMVFHPHLILILFYQETTLNKETILDFLLIIPITIMLIIFRQIPNHA